jgi:hypothetical protein
VTKNLEIFCVTDKHFKYLDKTKYRLAAVGKSEFPKNYISSDKDINIFHKEEYYSELTFHYWFWKNELKKSKYKNKWIGFCQKRRFWIKKKEKTFKFNNLLKKAPTEWQKFESVICEKIFVDNPKFMKMIKRGWRNIVKDPRVLFQKKKQTIKLHFDMFHGYGNIELAINLMHKKDKNEFRKCIYESLDFNPHIMFITKPKIMNMWFKDLFSWLFRCEKVFGFKSLHGYDTKRLYAYLAERYLSFWFRKYSKYIEWPYITLDITNRK